MAYTGTYRVGGARFNDQQVGEEFKQALQQSTPGFQGLRAGQYFTGEGGTQFKTVAGVDPNKPGWGQLVEPGYELIGYQGGAQPTGRARGMGIGQTTPGFAILKKIAQPTPEPVAQQQTQQAATTETTKTDKADEITQQAEDTVSEADKIKLLIDDWERRQEEAAKRAEELRIQSQKTFAANMERANMTPNLQIMPATGTPQMAGTQGFKSRRRQASLGTVGSVLAGLNLGQTSMMNV